MTPALGDRALATVETIAALRPIPDADLIEAATIRGWTVVVRKGEFAVGDPCVYFEIDSMLDVTDPRFQFLAPRGVRTDASGRDGHVLKTIRLRGQYSQGLALPLDHFPKLPAGVHDVTEHLPIWKWEPRVPADISGQVRGLRPHWIPKTDETRVQNAAELLRVVPQQGRWVATEKIDGTSMTVYVSPEDWGVCSRNYDLREGPGTLWTLARRHDLIRRMHTTWPGDFVAVQGEAYGEGIQGNPLRVRGQHLALFSVLHDGRYVAPGRWPDWARELAVPVVPLTFPDSVEQALADVEHLPSAIGDGRPAEGVVWRHDTFSELDGVRLSFKVVSNRYLLKHDR